MAGMMRDPAKTGITETGPVPHMPSPQGADPGHGAGGGQPHVNAPGAA
jgi:hypothetical protein